MSLSPKAPFGVLACPSVSLASTRLHSRAGYLAFPKPGAEALEAKAEEDSRAHELRKLRTQRIGYPKVPFDQFDVRSIDNARNATENQGYRDQFLASIRDRLGTAAVKGQALDLCQELFVADGARSDEEDAVLQNLRTLLE
jgi:hypothetical protein